MRSILISTHIGHGEQSVILRDVESSFGYRKL